MDEQDGRGRVLDVVSMGCRWVFDLSALEAGDASAMAARWQRCIDLAGSGTPLLDAQPVRVRAMIAPAEPPTGPPDQCTVIARDADRLPYHLSREVTRAGLTRLRGRATLLHAAALADEAGRAVALVAPSGGGKSTAARILGRRLGYLSDESVVLLTDDRIAPHPKPLSLVTDPGDPGAKEERPPDELGLLPTSPRPRLASLLTLRRDPTARTPLLQPVGLLDQILAVLPETSSMWWLPGGLHRLARAVTAGGEPRELRYAEIETCHDLVAEHLAAARRGTQTWQHLPPGPNERLADNAPDLPAPEELEAIDTAVKPTDRVLRAPWSDAIAIDGEVLVLAGARPLRLAGPGAVIWQATATPRTIDELTRAVVDVLGDHPDAEDLVRDAVAELERHAALQIVRR